MVFIPAEHSHLSSCYASMLEFEILLKQSQVNLHGIIINLEKMLFNCIISSPGPPFLIDAVNEILFSIACLTTKNSELMCSEWDFSIESTFYPGTR